MLFSHKIIAAFPVAAEIKHLVCVFTKVIVYDLECARIHLLQRLCIILDGIQMFGKSMRQFSRLRIGTLIFIFTGKEKASDSLQGPIGIATIYGGVWDWYRFWTITGLLSMVLAFMNILPIPALDGGHVVFLVIEAVTRRKFSDKFMERAQVTGMVILLSLMVFTIGNDIWKHLLN